MTQKRGLGNHGSSAGFKARASCRPIFRFRVLMHHRYRVHARAETGFYLLCIRLCWASRKSRLGILRHGCFARWDERGQDDGGYKYEAHTHTHTRCTAGCQGATHMTASRTGGNIQTTYTTCLPVLCQDACARVSQRTSRYYWPP